MRGQDWRARGSLLVVVVATLLPPTLLTAETRVPLAEGLAGVCDVPVSVYVNAGDALSGLAPELERSIAEALRGGGLVSESWRRDQGEHPLLELWFSVDTVEDCADRSIIVTDATFVDAVRTSRRPDTEVVVATWSRHYVDQARTIDVKEQLQASARQIASAFLREVNAVNEREEGSRCEGPPNEGMQQTKPGLP